MRTLKLKWGVLGTGWIADLVAQDLALEGVKITAIGSRSVLSAQKFAAKHDVTIAFGSYQELCASPEIDAVYVATPNPFHYENAKLALEAGKHVLVEKPFAMNAREAASLMEIANGKKLFLMEAMWSRFLPSQLAVKKCIESGQIGEVLAVTAEHSQHLPKEGHLRLWDKSLGGGALLDLGVYPLALIQSLLGKPSKTVAVGSLAGTGVDQRISASFEFPSGSIAALFTSMQIAGPANATIYGSLGRIEIEKPLWGQFEFSVVDLKGELVSRYSETILGTGRQRQFFAVDEAILSGRTESEIMPLSDTLVIAETMDEIRRQVGVRYKADE